jgi:hypothetical protein
MLQPALPRACSLLPLQDLGMRSNSSSRTMSRMTLGHKSLCGTGRLKNNKRQEFALAAVR